MKKLFAIILTFTLILSLSACEAEQTALSDDKADKSANNSSVESQPQTVVVPNVVGMDKDEAVKTLEDLGLKVEVEWGHRISDITKKPSTDNQDLVGDNIIFNQDIKENVIVMLNAKIVITCNTNTDSYEYKINSDNTITLIKAIRNLIANNEIVIPNSYHDYTVSSITSSCLEDMYERKVTKFIENGLTPPEIIVPKNINIDGELLNAKITRLQ